MATALARCSLRTAFFLVVSSVIAIGYQLYQLQVPHQQTFPEQQVVAVVVVAFGL